MIQAYLTNINLLAPDEGAFYMAKIVSADEFWNYPYTRSLPPKGKLALYYALGREHDKEQIIIEDMAEQTGIEMSECGDWLEKFIGDKQIERSLVLDLAL